MNLYDLPIGVVAIVTKVTDDERLSEIFIKGERVRVIAKTPFGGPVAVKVYGTAFALNEHEAKSIEVTIL